jgi:two-component system NtrC family sensor kinase
MRQKPKIEDLIGLGHSKLGFFKEVQEKMAELRKSNREIEHQRQHVQATLDGITDIVAVISPEYRIRSVNHSFFDIYAHPAPEDQPCYHIFRGRSEPCRECILREAQATNRVCRLNTIIPVNGATVRAIPRIFWLSCAM